MVLDSENEEPKEPLFLSKLSSLSSSLIAAESILKQAHWRNSMLRNTRSSGWERSQNRSLGGRVKAQRDEVSHCLGKQKQQDPVMQATCRKGQIQRAETA